MKEIGTLQWSLIVPDSWEFETDSDCTSIWHAESIGALQVSCVVKDGTVTDSDLFEFANENLQRGRDPVKVNLGDFTGILLEFVVEETAWRFWYLRSEDIGLFVTYNCEAVCSGLENERMDSVLATLKRF